MKPRAPLRARGVSRADTSVRPMSYIMAGAQQGAGSPAPGGCCAPAGGYAKLQVPSGFLVAVTFVAALLSSLSVSETEPAA